jgi:prefoldin alpha subunit
MAAEQKGELLDLTKLSVQQLDSLKTQLSQEIQVLQDSLSRLKMVQQSFVTTENTIESLKKYNNNETILVPLTSSLYVPGKLLTNQRVTIDVGTGYYVNRSIEDAKKHFEKKVTFLTKQLEKLQPILQQKVMIRDEVIEVIQYKMQLMAAQQRTTAAQ